jgi:hypothetical protein
MPTADRSLRRALVASTREHPLDQPVPELRDHADRYGLAAVGEAARRHGVVGCLWTALRGTGLTDRDGAAAVRAHYQAAVASHLRTLVDLDLVDDTLSAAGIGCLILKGPVLAEAVYSRPDLRGYVDLDVLVPAADFPAAVAALERAGCRVYERNWRLARELLLGELRLFTPAGSVLDLHWHLTAERAVREAFRIDLAAVRARARRVPVGGRLVATLDRTDTVVHLALHASLAGGHRLVWLKDLEQALRAPDAPSWPEIAGRATTWRAGVAVGLMLARARGTLGVPVPDEVLDDLAPDRLWRSVARVADVLAPLPSRPEDASVARIVARAVRADPRSSRRELARRGLAWLWHGGPLRRSDVDRLFDPTDPESAAHPVGGEPGRTAYLDAVRRQLDDRRN